MAAGAAAPGADASAVSCAGLTVYFDGACPLCRREVDVYQSLAATLPVRWCDVSDTAATLPSEMSRSALLARFHVRAADGSLRSGASAFSTLWLALPGWRWLGRVATWPVVAPLMEAAYRGFLHLRPGLQRLAAAFEPAALHVPADLVADLRSDHAGETGAVWIYRGVLALSRDPALRDFARRHAATETRHRVALAAVLPWPQRSRLLVPWRLAGWCTGALPALAGPRAVYATIAAVETFVDHHYQQQIDRLAGRPEAAALRALLVECQADEIEHRDEARAAVSSASTDAAAPSSSPAIGAPLGTLLSLWCGAVSSGSALAVAIARRL